MKHLLALYLLAPLPLAWGVQPGADDPPRNVELRDLQIGELNFLHTVDTHGWHAGHLKQGSYSADWGDYITFSTLLKKKLKREGGDLILIDSGDRIRGNGLYGADKTPKTKTFEIFKKQTVDLLTIGNHELYFPETARDDRRNLVEWYKDKYMVGNLEIWDPNTKNMVDFCPTKFKKLVTEVNKIRITAFGMIYDGAVNETRFPELHITKVEDMVREEWFVRAITDEDVDVFVVVGHVPARAKPGGNDTRYPDGAPTEFRAVYDAIKGLNGPNSKKPIHFFGGDYHIRDYVKYDNTSAILASGMYLETIGFASIQGIKANAINETAKFTRRYIDNNVHSFQHHTGTDASSFMSVEGRNVTGFITSVRKDLGLDELYGCAPKTYWLGHKPIDDDQNMYKWLSNFVFVTGKAPVSGREGKKRMMFMNTGAMRYDFYQGEFTRDTAWSILPFGSPLVYLPDVRLEDAERASEKLLRPPEPGSLDEDNDDLDPGMQLAPQLRYLRQECPPYGGSSWGPQTPLGGSLLRYDRPLGYVTPDDDKDDPYGDDTVHSPLCNFYDKLPKIIKGQNFESTDPDVKTVDIVFNEYLKGKVLGALSGIKAKEDVKPYGPDEKKQEMRDFIIEWVKANWPPQVRDNVTSCTGGMANGEVPEL